jgi:hypothetical protein
MLQLRNKLVDVPVGWSFVVKETNERIHAETFDQLVHSVFQHMLINKIDIPCKFGAIIENDICTRIPKHMIKGDL